MSTHIPGVVAAWIACKDVGEGLQSTSKTGAQLETGGLQK